MANEKLLCVHTSIEHKGKEHRLVPALYTAGPTFYLLSESLIYVVAPSGEDNYDLTPSTQPALWAQIWKEFNRGIYHEDN